MKILQRLQPLRTTISGDQLSQADNLKMGLLNKTETASPKTNDTVNTKGSEGAAKQILALELARLPGSLVRVRNRCVLTGRGRSIWSAFRISRIQLRKLALEGVLMGVKRSSW